MACKQKLHKWKIADSDICERCHSDTDGIEHHLIACPQIIPFWNTLFKWWKATMSMMVPVDTYNIIFGLPNPNKDPIINQLNYTLLHATYFVYNCNRKEIVPALYNFLLELKSNLICKQISMTIEGKEEKFEKCWGELLNNF
jgi:hypothetical protein